MINLTWCRSLLEIKRAFDFLIEMCCLLDVFMAFKAVFFPTMQYVGYVCQGFAITFGIE